MDPLSITAGVIAVATLAFQSSKALHDLVETYRHSNKMFSDLSAEIDSLSGVLCSLQTVSGDDRGFSFSQTQCRVLKTAEVALRNCTSTLDAFGAKVNKLMSNSTAGNMSKRDKFLLHLKTNDIAAFRIQLGSYKSTLTIVLHSLNRKSSDKSNAELATKIDGVAGLLTGQMEGLKLAI
ncbi:hypothetical protein F5X68DRAFT_216602 [Plectosphaerella plurivora]|uniref:Azaphilone pigments biosynthesis cluster protein L N-terminal domain-containing protein n=1 Tax=Plectosphaerella plurivora TaxID=936078 RepID=A0A9P8V3I2_9PEZI|nr:hypothetical protein F5X68DRAFT_216602 [Plectosphaerella plurivora]